MSGRATTIELEKRRAAVVSLIYNVTFAALKLVAALLTGSVSLLSEATHSATDVVASSIALISVRAAAAPPDDEHPYGHGKIESLAGLGEAVLLLLIVAFLAFQAVSRFMQGLMPVRLDLAIGVMALSSITSFAVSRYVRGVGERTQSMALISNGQHLMVDCGTSVGVLVALAITTATGWAWADPVAGLLIAVWLGFGAWRLVRRAFNELIDLRLPDEEIARIESILEAESEVIGYHRLRTRHSGHTHYIDVHIVVPSDWSLVRAHDLADRLEKRIAEALPPAHVVIHVDPYDAAKAAKSL